jgi:uncharacterized protein YbjT (DUF2867 family)
VRLLVEQGYDVKALARSRLKAEQLFSDLPVTIVPGDMQDVNTFTIPPTSGTLCATICAVTLQEKCSYLTTKIDCRKVDLI